MSELVTATPSSLAEFPEDGHELLAVGCTMLYFIGIKMSSHMLEELQVMGTKLEFRLAIIRKKMIVIDLVLEIPQGGRMDDYFIVRIPIQDGIFYDLEFNKMDNIFYIRDSNGVKMTTSYPGYGEEWENGLRFRMDHDFKSDPMKYFCEVTKDTAYVFSDTYKMFLSPRFNALLSL